jgi:hypothetical protein
LLVFSDGSTIHVGELPENAGAAREISFPSKEVTWLAFLVDSVSKETSDAGLAEIAVFRSEE